MKSLVMLTAAATVAAIVSAHAQTDGQPQVEMPVQALTHKLDLSSVLCKELPGLSKPQVEQIVTWLQGYYTLENAPRVINPDKISADVGKLADYCKQNPEANLVAAADDVMGE